MSKVSSTSATAPSSSSKSLRSISSSILTSRRKSEMRTDKIYGTLPFVIERLDLEFHEMCQWLYLPIKVPGSWSLHVPANAQQFIPIITSAEVDFASIVGDGKYLDEYYAYLTAKTMYVNKSAPGNRPGWHSDGFMTDDYNYVWSDKNPTQFWHNNGKLVDFSADHSLSLEEMDHVCENLGIIRDYPNKTLLCLDQTVLHRVSPVVEEGIRTFVKVSFSKDRYALRGNSINHAIKDDFGSYYDDRQATRNDPAGKK
uniref:2OG-Fe(II) oxygenase n=1 Tax=Rhizobium phage LG08 TaxID=3129229 RepID=A0AAU8HY33_9CAUD